MFMHKISTQVVCLNDKHRCRAAFRVNSRPFPSSLGPLYQNEGKCSAFDMEMIFHCHPNKIHFHKKGCACCLGFWNTKVANFFNNMITFHCRRLDYFVVSERLVPKLSDSLIRQRVKGSDHCPAVLLLAL